MRHQILDEQAAVCVTVHAPSLSSASLPLCGAKEFRCVTMNFQSVTCIRCAVLLNGKTDDTTRLTRTEDDS